MDCAIVWFRQDLRLADNPALTAALSNHKKVIPFFCHYSESSDAWAPGEASYWWLHHSLLSLSDDIKARGSRLIIRQGEALNTLKELIRETNATDIYCNFLYEPSLARIDSSVRQALEKDGIHFHAFHGSLLKPPSEVKNKSDLPYRVFTPFYRFYLQQGFSTQLAPKPRKLAPVSTRLQSLNVNELNLLPTVKWYSKLGEYWQPGEQPAIRRLQKFCKQALGNYPEGRDIPSVDGTTNLSPYLHFGEISPRTIIGRIEETASSTNLNNAKDEVIRELVWRDFASHILVHFPYTTDKPFQESFSRFSWKKSDKHLLDAWQRGQTGIPIIDAGMRQLWDTGWMHNRVRMIVASFLTKNGNLHWLNGARWFWDTLVDADLANNSMNWQWVAGCGVDAAPYFRIFNPVTQGRKFDPEGEYVRQWVPELSVLPARYIHEPWTMPDEIQKKVAIVIEKDYPAPVLDISETRKQALANYNQFRQNT